VGGAWRDAASGRTGGRHNGNLLTQHPPSKPAQGSDIAAQPTPSSFPLTPPAVADADATTNAHPCPLTPPPPPGGDPPGPDPNAPNTAGFKPKPNPRPPPPAPRVQTSGFQTKIWEVLRLKPEDCHKLWVRKNQTVYEAICKVRWAPARRRARGRGGGGGGGP
jgi:hypothetical protein